MPVVQAESEHNPPVNGSYFARVNPEDGRCLLEKYSEKHHDFGCALLANLFASEGQPGKVIFLLFYYSYVHTRLGSFLPPAPTPSLTTHLVWF
jgi:hypothetical protein